MNKNKFFSIIIPTYNSKRLKAGLDSIESQSCLDDIEIIIVDDNSTDKSYLELLKNYSFDYKLIENDQNLGPGLARQTGLDAAKGQWVTFLDHDDHFTPDCFHMVKTEIENNPDVLVVVTNVLVAENEEFLKTGRFITTESENSWLHGRFFKRSFLVRNCLRFHTTIKAHEDIYFCAITTGFITVSGLQPEKTILNLPFITYYWYLWEDSTSHTEDDQQRSYIVTHFEDFITSNYDVYKFLYSIFPNKEYKYKKLTSILLYCYLFYEKFYYTYLKTGQDISNILFDTKKFKEIVKQELNYTEKELYESLIEEVNAERYFEIYNKVNECHKGFYMPLHSLKEFLSILDNYN